MNKVYVLPPKENWIIDRFTKEWYEDNSDISVFDCRQADVIWLFSDWCWRNLPIQFLKTKKVVTTIHHIVPEKFGIDQINDFKERDSITHIYHTPSIHTKKFIESYTNKPIKVIPYWANQKIWKKTGTKEEFRKKYNIPLDATVIGSFQRDTEGSDLKSPKLEKGPDLLAEYLTKLKETSPSIHVVLSGWRRQYIISKLNDLSIPFTYIELPSQEIVNELYQTLDLYPVTSRYEGGPQSLIECGLLDVSMISRSMGMAEAVLPSSAIHDDVIKAIPAIPNVKEILLPFGYKAYRDLFNQL
ncbi:MAG: hypothetical protein EBU90_12345 [Proteobacteria bacterium]|nr:hypothetical protein [Pseudomonadota bacterium]